MCMKNRNIQRAIMEVLFRPEIEGARRRGSDTDSSMSGESVVNDKTDSETALSLPMRTDSHDLDGVLGGYAGVRRRWELQGENKAFSCMLWCTIAIGAMTSNLRTITVSDGREAVVGGAYSLEHMKMDAAHPFPLCHIPW